MRVRLVTAALLVGAALANLPVVYLLIRTNQAPPIVALAFGFLSMGLGWAAGFRIEGKQRWFVVAMGGVGVFELASLALPYARESRVFIVAGAALSAGALVMLSKQSNARA